MDFAEKLPDSCPPSDATDVELSGVYRLTPTDSPTEQHFASHAALGKVPPRSLSDLCRWASCSLTTDPRTLKKLSKLRHRFAVRLNIPSGSGLSKKYAVHVDFWRSINFDPTTAIDGLEEV